MNALSDFIIRIDDAVATFGQAPAAEEVKPAKKKKK